MKGKILFEVVSPQRLVVSEEVDEVTAPGVEGEFGVLPGHIPFITTLKIGEIMYRRGASRRYMAVTWGFAEVLPDKVTILCESAELADEIDIARAVAERERAEAQLRRMGVADKDYWKVKGSLDKAITEVVVYGKKT
ncbi:MAG: F0F1 ATP synthase subunit epsilon [Deltaproteobacteria bacterium]|nr:F0F1 ATP synthase subunit epsilon [Deltaproteobacteria bacterium]MBW2122035.1 F0F1 ATP synthase subunit epsilon [Deltaproteobacteria bacterium]